MVKFYIKEQVITESNKKNAGSKARADMNFLLEKNQYNPINIDFVPKSNGRSLFMSLYEHIIKFNQLKKILSLLKKGDELVIQFPMFSHTILFFFIIKNLIDRGVNITLLVHDIEILRTSKENISLKMKIRILIEELSILRYATKIIVHNAKMKEFLVNKGVDSSKLIELDIFDYLIPEGYGFYQNQNKLSPIIIAGNLSPHKAGYLNSLPLQIQFNLYGIGYQENIKDNHICYKGAFIPDELLTNLEGSFGLIWDGDSSDTCSGSYGNYLKYNNSHKASLYLVAGYPLIAWKESALADFIAKHQCGFTIDSISQIISIIKNLSDEQYFLYKRNAEKLSFKIRNGYFLENALRKCNGEGIL